MIRRGIRVLTVRIISLVLIVSFLLASAGCSDSPPHPALSDPNPQTITEDIETESVITEDSLREVITAEVYLNEIVLVEDKITELLLEEDTIEEVIYCSTIYVPQDNIEEFAKNSQAAKLFGDGVDIEPILTKLAVGTGLIITTVILERAGKRLMAECPVAGIIITAGNELFLEDYAKGMLADALADASGAIDETGRLAAAAGFAYCTYELIDRITGLLSGEPDDLRLAFAGIDMGYLSAAEKNIDFFSSVDEWRSSFRDMVDTFRSTDASELDWNDIDWKKAGVSDTSQGNVWGAVSGDISESGQSYFNNHFTPYTKYEDRLALIPRKKGEWSGIPGESEFILKKNKRIKLDDGTVVEKVGYRNALPDFSPYAIAEVNIRQMTNNRSGKGGNFEQADQALADYWTEINYDGKAWTARDIEKYRRRNGLTWYEMSNMESMQLIPSKIDRMFTHSDGVAEFNAMTGEGQKK